MSAGLDVAGALAAASRGIALRDGRPMPEVAPEQLPAGDAFRWAPARLIDLVIAARPELPREWAMVRRDETTAWWLLPRRKLRVCELLERRAGELWHHVVVSHPTRDIRLEEAGWVRDLFMGADREVLMLVEPSGETGGYAPRVRLASCRGRDNPLVPPVAIVSGGAAVPAAAGGTQP